MKPEAVKTGLTRPRVTLRSEVSRRIRQHCRSSMKAEVCGVLIGERRDSTVEIENCIAGVNAAQGGAHVTFTQDAWEHIYNVKDRDFPDGRIIGWYHSHPGFGVFLSEHDEFIQKNFFSAPDQIAWVYDPHTDEEGCFGWVDGRIRRLTEVLLHDDGLPAGRVAVAQPESLDDDDSFLPKVVSPKKSGARPISFSAILPYVAILLLGVVIGGWFGLNRGFNAGVIEEYEHHILENSQKQFQPDVSSPPNELQPGPSPSNLQPKGPPGETKK